jgi:hypothetical protein
MHAELSVEMDQIRFHILQIQHFRRLASASVNLRAGALPIPDPPFT